MPRAPKRRGPTRVRKQKTDRRQSSTQRGYGSKWQRYRAAYLSRAENALCRICQENGIVKAASVIDHIIPHRGDWKLFWKSSNHQPLCPRCHNQKTVREDGGFGNRRMERNPMPPKKTKLNRSELSQKIIQMETQLDRGKKNYAKASKLFDELLKQMKPGDKIKLPDGRIFEVIDPFLRSDGTLQKVWKPAGVTRYEWKISHG